MNLHIWLPIGSICWHESCLWVIIKMQNDTEKWEDQKVVKRERFSYAVYLVFSEEKNHIFEFLLKKRNLIEFYYVFLYIHCRSSNA